MLRELLNDCRMAVKAISCLRGEFVRLEESELDNCYNSCHGCDDEPYIGCPDYKFGWKWVEADPFHASRRTMAKFSNGHQIRIAELCMKDRIGFAEYLVFTLSEFIGLKAYKDAMYECRYYLDTDKAELERLADECVDRLKGELPEFTDQYLLGEETLDKRKETQ